MLGFCGMQHFLLVHVRMFAVGRAKCYDCLQDYTLQGVTIHNVITIIH